MLNKVDLLDKKTVQKIIKKFSKNKKSEVISLSTFNKNYEYNLQLINETLDDFNFSEIEDGIDTIVTDVPEPWEFFTNNTIDKDLTWISYLPSISQVEKIIQTLKAKNFKNIEIKENLERYWIIKENILRPKNEMVGHTGFIVSSRYIL